MTDHRHDHSKWQVIRTGVFQDCSRGATGVARFVWLWSQAQQNAKGDGIVWAISIPVDMIVEEGWKENVVKLNFD